MPEGKMNKMSGLICSDCQWVKFAVGLPPMSICWSRTKSGWRSHTDLHFTALPFSRCQSPHCISSSNKKSCWHAACPRGVIHHCERKAARDGFIQKDLFACVHYFDFWFFLHSATRQYLKLVLTHPTEPKAKIGFGGKEQYAPFMASFSPAGKILKP